MWHENKIEKESVPPLVAQALMENGFAVAGSRVLIDDGSKPK